MFDNLNSLIGNAFGLSVTFTPFSTGTSQTITGTVQNPAIDEDKGVSDGQNVVRLFVDYSKLTPQPVKGDSVTINTTTYVVQDIKVDIIGGAVLFLRRRSA